jgi:RNA polymerase sigma-70 factor (ECF subfamily)
MDWGAIVMGTASPSDDDLALLSAHMRGDESAFAILMVRYQGRLRGMCWNYLHDAEMVEDVLQDTFCQMLQRVHRLDGDLNLSAWVHRVAANLCIDELRRRSRRSELHAPGDVERALGSVIDDDRRGRPEDAFDLDVTRRLVRAAILQLPESQRDVLILRDVCGHSEAETARALGTTTGSVQGVLHRARERFRDAYIAMEYDQALPGECGQVAFVFENLRLAALRKDRLGAVQRHLDECRWCRTRFARAVSARNWPAPDVSPGLRPVPLRVVAA